MECCVQIERWEHPIFKAEPSGFDYIEVSLTEPSCVVKIKATIPLQKAIEFADRLMTLAYALQEASS